ncbi:ParM/StbA family protein [Sulfobacillus harzensis]|uniref:ParM/StbA family protein n=1 Tax=Sulfobacillus harzensis TaxID=2729629 RepID=A0A7Y0L811_9FIRM|nr:ParM/StbA family protein [Sulfobacillus harzensis]NMP24461.1 ParM/StbA family protein [Sulfobacillus harzensis]
MTLRIAVDAGHGYTKALGESGERVLFPSLIAPAPASVDLGEYAQVDTVWIDGQPYVIGEPARSYATPLWSRDKATDEDTLRLILVAAAELGAVGPVALATGLPLSWFGSQRRAFREALTGFGGVVQRAGQPPQRVWFESVMVLPQGVAAAGSLLAAPTMESGAYLVVDVGYRTTDYIVVEKSADGGLDYEPSAAGSLELGMHTVSQAVADEISSTHQVDYTPAEVEGRTHVVVRGQKLDVTQRAHEAREAVGRQIAKVLAERLGPQADKLLGIVAVGGGSDILPTAIPGTIVPPDPQWANAQGYLLALR